ncbi:beta-lactamase family protein [Phycicoccus sp. CMS6Z-2]|nr:beta-lactamase family protein [Phycicoccus flavus]
MPSLSKPVAALLAAGLVHEGLLDPDADVLRWVPELDGVRVLRRPDGPLDDTEPLAVPMTTRHLLTTTSGLGIRTTPTPLSRAMADAGVHPGLVGPRLSREELLARLAGLPLAFQPGAAWAYHTSTDVLGTVLERASGVELPELVAARVTGPLGTPSVSFDAPPPDRLAPAFWVDDEDAWYPVDPRDPDPSVLPTLASGLWGRADETLAVFDELARPRTPPPSAIEQIRVPALTDAQRTSAPDFLPPGYSYGWQVSVALEDDPRGPRRGAVGWMGGTGTWALVDPAADRSAVLLTNRGLDGPHGAPAVDAFLADVREAEPER